MACSSSLCALSVALYFLRPAPPATRIDQATLDDPRVRDRVVALLAERATGANDSHNDPEVGRVLVQHRTLPYGAMTLNTNRFGMREREYALPKPDGVVRVVLLGDSYVFGSGAPAEERFGVHLKRWLRERSGRNDVEVLHVGISSWNALAEAVYLRRQLSLLQPDLVIHLTLQNDLDDVEGVRGFGELARFSSHHRERAAGVVRAENPSKVMGLDIPYNVLFCDHDAESRERWDEAEQAVFRLAQEVERLGAKYLHLFRWPGLNARARARLGRRLADDQVAFVSTRFVKDRSTWVSPDDGHWNPEGMRAVALLCFGLIQERGLLPGLDLAPWKEADQAVARLNDGAANEHEFRWMDDALGIDSVLRLEDLAAHPEEGCHVYAGIDREGLVGPFASLSLRNVAGGRLHLLGQCLDRQEMDGAHLTAWAEGLLVGTCELRARAALDVAWTLPAELAAAKFVNVRLVCDDWVYEGDDLQDCVCFRLRTLGIEGP